ncbi:MULTISPECIES: hypothetical protein [unclassified Burkholderia]|uniref:hypothetical protein n=1 Tax=unclassified Burkholderia TaxID=2613784 RepID=UPI000F5901A9|nr:MULTISPECIES: hypothetical protein [unclassified Burkholderia]RQS22453.1 hypothetical protein DIE05_29990 [Burkholderia sp. Bp8995]RQS39237.1 hypothetical protein DIE00_34095 [Burkholderia sp. Bp8989]
MMELKDWITGGTAVTGAVLGLFNLWRQMSTDRVKLRVSPAIVIDRGPTHVLTHSSITIDPTSVPEYVQLSVEVLNLSTFPVTIEEIGMTTHSPGRMVFAGAHTSDNKPLPLRLESREAIKLYTKSYLTSEFAQGVDVFAETVCGHRQLGKSPAIESLKAVAARVSR